MGKKCIFLLSRFKVGFGVGSGIRNTAFSFMIRKIMSWTEYYQHRAVLYVHCTMYILTYLNLSFWRCIFDFYFRRHSGLFVQGLLVHWLNLHLHHLYKQGCILVRISIFCPPPCEKSLLPPFFPLPFPPLTLLFSLIFFVGVLLIIFFLKTNMKNIHSCNKC